MKKKVCIGAAIVLVMLAAAGIITHYVDSKYDLPSEKRMTVAYEGGTIEISNRDDVNKIYDILVNAKYDSGVCDCAPSHTITVDDEIYRLKEDSQAVEKGTKQADISATDLNTILEIIEKAQ